MHQISDWFTEELLL